MSVQKINKKGLQELYKNVCPDWQKTISELVLFQEGKEIEVEEELIQKAYNEANSEQKKLLNKFFKVKSDKIWEEINTWDKILEKIGLEESVFIPFSGKKLTKEEKSINAQAR